MLNRFILQQIERHFTGFTGVSENQKNFLQSLSDQLDKCEAERKKLEYALALGEKEKHALAERLSKETLELKKANEQLTTLFEKIDTCSFSVDMISRQTLQISPACTTLYGIAQQEFMDDVDLWYKVILDEDKPIVQANYPTMLEGRKFTQVYRILRKDGTVRWLETKITPTLGEGGKLLRIDGLTTDVTAPKQAEEQLLYNERRFRHLIEKSHDGISLLSREGKLIYVTPSVKRILGYETEELVNADPSRFTHPDDLPRLVGLLSNLMTQYGKNVHAVYRMQHKKGHWCWISAHITNLLREPSIGAIVFNYEDITERVKAQTQLERDRRNNDALINSTSDLMWSIDKDMHLIMANNAFLYALKHWMGVDIKPGDLLIDKRFSAAERKKWTAFYKRALAGETFTVEEYNTYPTESWGEITLNPIMKHDKVVGAACFSRDITEQKRNIKLLEQNEKRMAAAEQIAHLGSWELDMVNEENILFWSNEVYRMFGRKPGKYKPTFAGFLQSIHPEDKEQVTQAFEDSFYGKSKYAMDFRIVLPEGDVRWVRADGDVVTHKKNGRLLRMIGTLQDITERKLTEEERIRITQDLTQRNKDLEQFTYIVSHNLRSPVTNISGLIGLLQNQNLDPASHNTCLKGLESSAKRLDQIIIDLNYILQVKKEVAERRENVRLSDITQDIYTSIQNIMEQAGVTLKTDFSEVDRIYTVKSYLYSVLYNLISNAVKYHRPQQEPMIEVKSEKTGTRTTITVKDNGMGIDMALHGDKIFGLYKRFHLHIEGKGIGLFMVKTQVEALGGEVSIESQVNVGTTFRLTF